MVKLAMSSVTACALLLLFTVSAVTARAQTAATAAAVQDAKNASAVTDIEDSSPAADAAADEVTDAAAADEEGTPVQYPFRDLPADVLRDFPGLCFGSTALRLFQVGQSWSLTPFCGVATCLVSRDGFHLMERVQDCGPQPLRNPRCKNVNLKTDHPFPGCCPKFECEEGVELEYPTQEELQQLAHEAAQAAVRAQYEEDVEGEEVQQSARVSADKTDVIPTEEDQTDVATTEDAASKDVAKPPAKPAAKEVPQKVEAA